MEYSKHKYEKIKHNVQRRERKIKPTCNSNVCRKAKKRNCSKFSEASREFVFKKFWRELDWPQRKIFVASNVIKGNTARGKEESRRQGTYTYFLNSGEERLQVCRLMFINTFGL